MAVCKSRNASRCRIAGEKCDAVADLHFDASYPVSQITAYCSDGMVSADLLCGSLRVQRATCTRQTLDDLMPPQQTHSRLSGTARARAEQDIRSFLSGESFFPRGAGTRRRSQRLVRKTGEGELSRPSARPPSSAPLPNGRRFC